MSAEESRPDSRAALAEAIRIKRDQVFRPDPAAAPTVSPGEEAGIQTAAPVPLGAGSMTSPSRVGNPGAFAAPEDEALRKGDAVESIRIKRQKFRSVDSS